MGAAWRKWVSVGGAWSSRQGPVWPLLPVPPGCEQGKRASCLLSTLPWQTELLSDPKRLLPSWSCSLRLWSLRPNESRKDETEGWHIRVPWRAVSPAVRPSDRRRECREKKEEHQENGLYYRDNLCMTCWNIFPPLNISSSAQKYSGCFKKPKLLGVGFFGITTQQSINK